MIEYKELIPGLHWEVYSDSICLGEMFHFHYCFPIGLFFPDGFYLYCPKLGLGVVTTGRTKEAAWKKNIELSVL